MGVLTTARRASQSTVAQLIRHGVVSRQRPRAHPAVLACAHIRVGRVSSRYYARPVHTGAESLIRHGGLCFDLDDDDSVRCEQPQQREGQKG